MRKFVAQYLMFNLVSSFSYQLTCFIDWGIGGGGGGGGGDGGARTGLIASRK